MTLTELAEIEEIIRTRAAADAINIFQERFGENLGGIEVQVLDLEDADWDGPQPIYTACCIIELWE